MAKLTWEEISQTLEFKRLTPKQQMFLCTYISNGYDPINACLTAYKCKSERNARIMTYGLLRHFGICMCISLHMGDDPQDTYCNQLARDILKGRITPDSLAAYRLYAEVKGWKKSAVVRAYELAKEMGYGPAQRRRLDQGSNLKQSVAASLKEAAKVLDAKEKKPGDYDLSEFEDQ
jgi:hypothetical protein